MPDRSEWVDVIPQKENTLTNCSYAGGKLFANYMEHASSKIEIYSVSGEPMGNVELPGVCTAGSISGTDEGTEAFYAYSSFNTPGTIYRYNTETGASELYFQPELKFNPDDFTVKQEFYISKDGTKIPMFIAHRKGLKLNGSNPTLLYGMVVSTSALHPSFSVANLTLWKMGAFMLRQTYVGVANTAKIGTKPGHLMKKQNVFDDFIAAAEYLVGQKYTKPSKLAIRGGSNGACSLEP